MKLKANELTGAALDWAVAKCEGMVPNTPFIASNKEYTFKPSTDWAQGGPIIERERITVEYSADPDTWCACIMADQEVYGPTALIAAMRCYVASEMGEEVEVPDELQGEIA